MLTAAMLWSFSDVAVNVTAGDVCRSRVIEGAVVGPTKMATRPDLPQEQMMELPDGGVYWIETGLLARVVRDVCTTPLARRRR